MFDLLIIFANTPRECVMQNRTKYPLGIQDFPTLIEEGYLYVDKTEIIYNLTQSMSRYIFLSRPRRFGKSLLVSTLKAYFEGRKELFKGLAIESLEKEWTEYPVLRFDMSGAKHVDKELLEMELNSQLARFEAIYGKNDKDTTLNSRLKGLIENAYNKAGQKVVVLVDEYDAPLLDVIHEDRDLPILRNVMRNFYSPLKLSDPYLRFVFLTGITKFSQLSIFSELNNIKNISMDENYAAICGITEEEMLCTMSEGIESLANYMSISKAEAIQTLKDNYDGYHFTIPSPDIYNPFSLLNALADRKLNAYWFGSGTPTYLIEMLNKYKVSAIDLSKPLYSSVEGFDAPTERITNITPLLYQSGYITIKDYDAYSALYTLGIPNREIKQGLMKSLIPNYLSYHSPKADVTIGLMRKALLLDNIDEMLSLLQDFLSTLPNTDNTNYEGHYQQILYILFYLAGAVVDIEVRTPRGRIDIVVNNHHKVYILELKIDKPASEALAQIDVKNYAERFADSNLTVVKVGIGFDSSTRNISGWEIA